MNYYYIKVMECIKNIFRILNNSSFTCEIIPGRIGDYIIRLYYYDYVTSQYQYSEEEFQFQLTDIINEDDLNNLCDECGVYDGDNDCYGCDHILYNYKCEDLCDEDEVLYIYIFQIYINDNINGTCCSYDDLDCYGICYGNYLYIDWNITSEHIPCCMV